MLLLLFVFALGAVIDFALVAVIVCFFSLGAIIDFALGAVIDFALVAVIVCFCSWCCY